MRGEYIIIQKKNMDLFKKKRLMERHDLDRVYEKGAQTLMSRTMKGLKIIERKDLKMIKKN